MNDEQETRSYNEIATENEHLHNKVTMLQEQLAQKRVMIADYQRVTMQEQLAQKRVMIADYQRVTRVLRQMADDPHLKSVNDSIEG